MRSALHLLLAASMTLLPVAAPGEELEEVRVTAYEVWAYDGPPDAKPPKELEKFLRHLRKSSKKRSFRLEKKPTSETLKTGKALLVALPDGYQVRLTVDKDREGKPAILQTLINPRKEESANLLKKSPVVTQIEKIRRGGEAFFLIVEFEPAKKKK